MSLNKKFATLVAAGTMMAAMGCASKPQTVTETEQTRKSYTEEAAGNQINASAAREVSGRSFVEVEFKPGTADLTVPAQDSLRALVEQAAREGRIDEVMVLSWADDEFPSKTLKKLPKSQIDLATRRNDAIQNYLKSVRDVSVAKYNMAEQPNAFAKWFNTKDARLKRTLVDAGLPTTADDPQYPSKASHSVVITKLK